MPFSPDQISELELLCRFDLSSIQTGIKIHSSAEGDVIAATDRLFNRGMITQNDGGYLTDMGQNAAKHAQTLLSMLN
ncbi:MAG: TIGR02647 family protein [Sedimenticola sp.]